MPIANVLSFSQSVTPCNKDTSLSYTTKNKEHRCVLQHCVSLEFHHRVLMVTLPRRLMWTLGLPCCGSLLPLAGPFSIAIGCCPGSRP